MMKLRAFNIFLYLCVLLSGLVPRYILDFKIHAGIGISLYTIIVFITWGIFSRQIKIYNRIESYVFFLWLLLILCDVWRVEGWGRWAYHVDWLITAILFMQILYHKLQKESFEIIVRAIVDVLFIQIVIGLYEITFRNYLFETSEIAWQLYGNVAISMFYNLNDYATFTTTLLPFAFYLMIKKKGVPFKLYYTFIVATDIFLTLRSESRGAFLAIIIIIGMSLLLFFRTSWKRKMFGLATTLLAIVFSFLSERMQEVFFAGVGTVLDDQSIRSDMTRVNLIKNGLYFLDVTHGFGVGTGNLYQWLGEKSIYPIGKLRFIHNWYLEIAATFGVFMFILYMIFHIKIIICLVKNAYAERRFCNINNAVLISFVAFSVVSISSSSNFYSEWVWMYLVFVSTFVLKNINEES